MESEEERFKSYLEDSTYRFLQQMAKQMRLPSNVKKIHLIQLIHTKKFHSENLDSLVAQVKLSRKRKAVAKKILQQSTEITSTGISTSPPIHVTPRRSFYVGHRSPEFRPVRLSKVKANSTIQKCVLSLNKSDRCDRVLRSSNSVKKPSFIMNNTFIGILKSSNSNMWNDSAHSILKKQDSYQQLAIKTYANRNRDRLTSTSPISRYVQTSPPQPRHRRTISGIYPLNEIHTKDKNTLPDDIPKVIVRLPDGRLSKLNAIIQKPFAQHYEVNRMVDRTPHMSVETQQRGRENISFPNLTGITDIVQYDDMVDNSPFYQVTVDQRRDSDQRLPHIENVFSRFNPNQRRDLMQPIYVEVSTEAEISANSNVSYARRPDVASTTMLERLYNLKNAYVVHQPLAQLGTTSNTKCVYSTPLITTAKTQPSLTSALDDYNIASVAGDSQHYTELVMSPRVQDFFRNFTDDDTYMHRSELSVDTVQSEDSGATADIPEMVGDALEIISQDGDYMERMGMDIRMRCVICNWAGPKIILEHHIRKEHPSDIVKQESREWSTSFSCGVLTRSPLWLSQLVEVDSQLYVLSAKYEQPDCFMATLSTLTSDEEEPPTGRITFYNRVTGEPHSWQGEVAQLPPTLPYEASDDCLKLQLSRMNLLPNSANLTFINGALVMNATTKVVVGQPELDNVHIVLNVQLL